jgi:hypothetical protein
LQHGQGGIYIKPNLVQPFGTVAILLGLLTVAIQEEEIANYLVATGLLFYLAAWFDSWWNFAQKR